MSKLAGNTRTNSPRSRATSPVTAVAPAVNHEGSTMAFSRDAKSDLFLLAVTNFVSEDTFYETAEGRDNRFRDLVHAVTSQDADWVARFVPWLRNEANMRSAAIVMAAESAWYRITNKDAVAAQLPTTTVRTLVNSSMSRADEPAEFAAYWTTRFGRKSLPGGVQRGLQDAVQRLFNEYAALKYDGLTRAFRLGDVLELVHAQKKADWQGDLYEYLLDRRHHADNVFISDRVDKTFGRLPMIKAYRQLQEMPIPARRKMLETAGPETSELLKAAGMTWEDLSGWLQGPMDAKAWEAIIPSMGYMALLRNLRNFDEAGVSDAVARKVADKLSDAGEVARSRQLVFRFLSAYNAAPSDRWKWALGQALDLATANIPSFDGKSLILIDTSASMHSMGYSAQSTVTPAMAAALFGIALAKRGAEVEVYGFGDGVFGHDIKRGESVLREVERFTDRIGEAGHGTNIPGALDQYRDHKRVFLFTDMQTLSFYDRGGHYMGRGVRNGAADSAVPSSVPIYGFNLAGYATTAIESGSKNRHEFGGLTDRTFSMIKQIEQAKSATWPF